MTLFSYKVFVTIVEHMNFRKAAEELNLTPSAVSHCVSGMEEELGFPLFIRKNNRISLTGDAKSILPYIKQLLLSENAVNQAIAEIQGFEKGTVKISKTYQRIKGEDMITSPKTKKSNRTVQMPDFLCTEMQEFFNMQYGLKRKDRIFNITKSYLHHEMDRGSKAAGVKRIRIHDLRHSHISLLIDMGFSAVDIADRVGHESIEITYRYAHLFPSKQKEMAIKLDFMNKGV